MPLRPAPAWGCLSSGCASEARMRSPRRSRRPRRTDTARNPAPRTRRPRKAQASAVRDTFGSPSPQAVSGAVPDTDQSLASPDGRRTVGYLAKSGIHRTKFLQRSDFLRTGQRSRTVPMGRLARGVRHRFSRLGGRGRRTARRAARETAPSSGAGRTCRRCCNRTGSGRQDHRRRPRRSRPAAPASSPRRSTATRPSFSATPTPDW